MPEDLLETWKQLKHLIATWLLAKHTLLQINLFHVLHIPYTARPLHIYPSAHCFLCCWKETVSINWAFFFWISLWQLGPGLLTIVYWVRLLLKTMWHFSLVSHMHYNKNWFSENLGKDQSEINRSPYRHKYETKDLIHSIINERSDLLMAFTAMQN